jgi:hypothetical protein
MIKHRTIICISEGKEERYLVFTQSRWVCVQMVKNHAYNTAAMAETCS